jgi:hypothetical protein
MANAPYLVDPAWNVNLRKIPHLCGLLLRSAWACGMVTFFATGSGCGNFVLCISARHARFYAFPADRVEVDATRIAHGCGATTRRIPRSFRWSIGGYAGAARQLEAGEGLALKRER